MARLPATLLNRTLPRLAWPRRSGSALQPQGKPQPGRTRRAGAVLALLLGAFIGLVTFFPASWVAEGINQATQGRLRLLEAQGTIWQGSALPLLSGGAGSRDAMLLPSRLGWRLSPAWNGFQLQLSQDCCVTPGLTLDVALRWGEVQLRLQAPGDTLGQWPVAWLTGLGAPWNTLKASGQLQLAAHQLLVLVKADGVQVSGQAELTVQDAASRLSPLRPLGSYQLRLQAQPGQPARLNLLTLDGALQLSGSGELRNGRLSFRGQASARPGEEASLGSLLNLIGRRQGALSLISIG